MFAVLFAPVGLVLGIIAKKQIRRSGEGGDGFALAGIIVGAVGTVVYASLALVWLIALNTLITYY